MKIIIRDQTDIRFCEPHKCRDLLLISQLVCPRIEQAQAYSTLGQLNTENMHPRTQRNALAHLEDLFGNISEAVGLMAKSIRMRLQQHESCPCLCPYGLVISFYACVKSRPYHDHGRCNHCSLTMYFNCLESLLKIQFLVLKSVLITSFFNKEITSR